MGVVDVGVVVEVHDKDFVVGVRVLYQRQRGGLHRGRVWSRMLPLLSIISPIDTGTSSCLNR